MPARVLFRDSKGRDGQHELAPSESCYVGRALDCQIRTDDAMVSRKHSMIRFEDKAWVVEDLGSSNGTHVNEVRISKRKLKHNDVVRCGSLWLRYIEDGPIDSVIDELAAAPATPSGLDVPDTIATGHTPSPSLGISVASGGRSLLTDSGIRIGGDTAVKKVDELEELQARHDRQVAEAMRAKAESKTLKERLEELRKELRDRDDQIAAHLQVTEELRGELGQLREEQSTTDERFAELNERLRARDRQLDRAENEVRTLKKEMEVSAKELADAEKTKDEGWQRLNEQVEELERLREVIAEQERMAEERRVGEASQDQAIEEVRVAKEQAEKEVAQIRVKYDQSIERFEKLQTTMLAVEEENGRLGKLLADASAGTGESVDTQGLTDDLRDARVALKEAEGEVTQLANELEELKRTMGPIAGRATELERELSEAKAQLETASQEREALGAAVKEAKLAESRMKEQLERVGGGGDEVERLKEEVQRLEMRLEDVKKIQGNTPRADGWEESLEEVYDEINSSLAELRTNLSIVDDEFQVYLENNGTDSQALIQQTLKVLVESIGQAKESLTGLKQWMEKQNA